MIKYYEIIGGNIIEKLFFETQEEAEQYKKETYPEASQ